MDMTRDQARDYVRSQIGDYLRTVKHIDLGTKGNKAFNCLNPSHPDKHPSMSLIQSSFRVHCHACGATYDIFDLIGMDEGLTGSREIFDKAYEMYGVTIVGNSSKNSSSRPTAAKPVAQQPRPASQPAPDPEPETDYTEYFKACSARLSETDYHRGISEATLQRFGVGFDPAWRSPEAMRKVARGEGKEPPASPRLIIPTSKYSYIARDTRKPEEIPERSKRYVKQKEGHVHIFNLEAIDKDEPTFIVEGEIDALSIIDVGKNALGLGSIHNVDTLLRLLDERPEKTNQPIIVGLDDEKKDIVQQRRFELMSGLKKRGYMAYTKDKLYGEYETGEKDENGNPVKESYKDANEALVAGREALGANLSKAEQEAITRAEDEQNEERQAEQRESVAHSLQAFINHVKENRRTPGIPTGFRDLDEILNGGLYAGLYFVGAVTSLGKTTFCLQLADNAAAAGYDVLFFSLEMAKDELIAKSISRISFEEAMRKYGNTAHAKTTHSVMHGLTYNETDQEFLMQCISKYVEPSKNLYIVEGLGNIGVEQIRAKVSKHYSLTGKMPLVIIDYAQIMSPYVDPKCPNRSMTDKQNTDKNVLFLKQLSRDFKTPVIAISSFNRDNYTEPVNLAAFKESGAIEYSSDVLIGLQYNGMDYQKKADDKYEPEKEREVRVKKLLDDMQQAGKDGKAQRIQVKVLKNRNGARGSAYLDLYPKFNCYTDAVEADQDDDDGWEKSEYVPKAKGKK